MFKHQPSLITPTKQCLCNKIMVLKGQGKAELMQIKGDMNVWEDLGNTLRLYAVNILPKTIVNLILIIEHLQLEGSIIIIKFNS